MKESSERASIVAYFLSKYNKRALDALGYSSYLQAFSDLGNSVGVKPNYIKLRRDEFDVFMNGPRKGWNKRSPIRSVYEMHDRLKLMDFSQLFELTRALIGSTSEFQVREADHYVIKKFSEQEIEDMINFHDNSARVMELGQSKTRILNSSIIQNLKKLYDNQCQICGNNPAKELGLSIVEAHHIDYFSISMNNDVSNIIILCPNHHRIIHKCDMRFNREKKEFFDTMGNVLQVKLNFHL